MNDHRGSAPLTRRSSAARWWLLLCLLLAVVVTVAAVGLRAILVETAIDPPFTAPPAGPTGHAVTPSPSPSPAEPGAPGAPVTVQAGRGPLLPGIGAGQVYAQTATGVFRIELDTGQITRTVTPELKEHVTFLAGEGWVLVKSRWSPTGVLVRDGEPAAPLPRQFDAEGFLHLGPGNRLWVQPEPSADPRSGTTLRLAELDGRPVPGRSVTAPSTAAPYELTADGYGGWLMTGDGGVFYADPGRPGRASRFQRITRGDLVAAGGRRLLVWDCDSSARCQMLLVDQRDRHRTSRPTAARALLAEGGVGIDRNRFSGTLLSPDGTHLAVMAGDSTGRFRVHVIDLRGGQDTVLPGTSTDTNANRQLAWSPNSRWLLALTDHQIRGYDTRSQTVRNLSLGNEQLLHLTTANAPGW